LVDFLSGRIPFEDVRGVSYLNDGLLERTPDGPVIRDLDSLPFPARDLLPLNLYKERMNGRLMTTLITSRGCPYNCDFCSSSRFFGAGWRARSVENILEEIGLLHEDYGYRAISFVDDNFTADPRRATEISETIIAREWDLVWAAMSRVDTIVKNPGMVRAMAKAGFRWTFIGFESGNQKALDGYGKKALTGDSLKAMDILRENGVEVTGAFILGAPGETKDMIKETISFAKRLDPRRAQFSILTPYPGTELYDKVENRLLTRDWRFYSGMHPTIELEHVTPEELRRLHILAYSSFYGRPKKAVENISYICRMVPGLAKHLTPSVISRPIRLVSRPIMQAKDRVAAMHRLLS
jgi:anaerobic magnesium-protoporphyrin IX monomethyl ester cyclase